MLLYFIFVLFMRLRQPRSTRTDKLVPYTTLVRSIVEAINGATTASGTFALNHRVAVGAYEYFLFRGGVLAGTTDNWYLRSTLPPAPTPTPKIGRAHV